MQNIKGTYDYYGAEQAVRQKVQTVLRGLFGLYDYEPMETTLLNELELLTSKYAGGDEILREMYQLTDQGGRTLGLRYDLTIPFAKVLALNPGIALPFKRYEIGKVFRDGPVKRGRLREFLQCDADVAGIAGPQAEAELMQLAADVFRQLDIPVVLKWNNRRFLGEILSAAGVPAEDSLSVMLTLDKLAKIGTSGVLAELQDKGIRAAAADSIARLLESDDTDFSSLADSYKLAGQPGALEVLALQQLIDATGLSAICVFDPFLSRGLSFYTGTVYEIFDATGGYTSSLGSGGRYDNIIGRLVGREDLNIPTVGISFGMESIMALLSERPVQEEASVVLLIPVGETMPQVLSAAAGLRNAGIRTSVDTGTRKLKKTLAAASARGIRYCLLIGESEASLGKLRLKDMGEQTEQLVTVEEAQQIISG
ncbi:histidine--tRNA ligase [Paenibacillus sp. FSL R7-0331]|uniref:histidine--tRNA ligase n=1 Tax=Paenibacillus sp. FSL R7-0331 TaxID=1536773 RepID=UPI0004F8EC73|nr:histidine--tRNA ligase [Paenibacillus sp. FSL R7-0331]AIQ51972.1 histidyl-tRNA synthetase [Paenibacillus sp. FSL R7-0331]